ncbi:hypothetical protein [Streptomyces sp. NPDC053069]|uniref:hypothetical protein n=1 Tax=Streptomyces sp. NPDC053069 TaxID=3365695 RepID=UPI0037D73F9C
MGGDLVEAPSLHLDTSVGCGCLLITPAVNVVLVRIELGDVGIASGVLSTAPQIGAALGVAVIGAVFYAAFGHPAIDRAHAAGHTLATARRLSGPWPFGDRRDHAGVSAPRWPR